MLINMNYEERERLAYAEGYPEAARLLARVSDLEHAAAVLLDALDAREPNDLNTRAAINELQELLS